MSISGWAETLDKATAAMLRSYGRHDSLQSIWIAKHRDARHIWRNLLERLQPFASDRRLEIRETGEVASRSAEVGDNACALGIGDPDKYRLESIASFAAPRPGPMCLPTRMTSGTAATSAAA